MSFQTYSRKPWRKSLLDDLVTSGFEQFRRCGSEAKWRFRKSPSIIAGHLCWVFIWLWVTLEMWWLSSVQSGAFCWGRISSKSGQRALQSVYRGIQNQTDFGQCLSQNRIRLWESLGNILHKIGSNFGQHVVQNPIRFWAGMSTMMYRATYPNLPDLSKGSPLSKKFDVW